MPIVPGSTEPSPDVKAATKTAKEIGYPVACKAAGGGGGKGFRVAMTEDELADAFEGAAREGEKFFSDDRVYLERYLEDPRHVEVQVLADSHGQRDPPRRARLLDPAPPPEADRGGARAAGGRGDARADRQDRHRRGRRRRLPRRRDDRGHAGRRRLLLPRDEHPRPGRALRDRDGHRHRHRPRAGPRRRRRAALDRPGRTSSSAATRSSAGSTPRPRTRTSRPRRGRSRPTSSRPGPACGWTRASRPAAR